MSYSACRLASLLNKGNGCVGDGTLTKLAQDVEKFLERAANVPPVVMEDRRRGTDSPSASSSGDEAEVHLSVVAGVLEPRETPADASVMSGLILPTMASSTSLERQKVQEAQSMLNLMAALMPGGAAAKNHSDEGAHGGKPSPKQLGCVSSRSSDSGGSVAVFDADELESETSSAHSDPEGEQVSSSWIVELN
ncbi:hypothetical protein ERJ75_001731600 [Trypanosoma vivax]|nr:hypothetical protein ERJ75_001731600 [Trypanosoma vivax]